MRTVPQNTASTGWVVIPARREVRDVMNHGEAKLDFEQSRGLSVQPLLQVEDLTIAYRAQDGQQFLALDGLSFEIACGEAVGVLGESGCGKTTLGLALLGLLAPAGRVLRGSAFFRGSNLLALAESELQEIRGAAISMVHQEPGAALNPVLRIGEQLTDVICAHRPLSRERAREEAGLLLAKVGFPPETCIVAAYPHQLSGGQQQRVAIAQAIACRPSLLIADEPTTALDKVTQLSILDLLTRLREKLHLAVLLITHDAGVLARTVDRILVIRDGRLIEQGQGRELMRWSRDSYTQALLQSSPVVARRRNHQAALADTSDPVDPGSPDQTETANVVAIRSMVQECRHGLDVLTIGAKPRERRNPEPLLFVENLHKRYLQGRWLSRRRHQVDALYGVELQLQRGSTLALIGASGSGKSTLARCLACLEKPDSGEIWFEGVNLTALTDHELVPFRRQIQLIFQDPGSSLNPGFTAVEIIAEPLLAARRGTKKQCQGRALELIEQVGLRSDWGQRFPHQFSAGQRRRLAIARALSLEPKLLILDEALAGLDRLVQAQIVDLLLRLQTTLSLTYLYISHDLGLVTSLADRVIVLRQGQIVETASVAELLAHPQSVQAINLVGATQEQEPVCFRSQLA
jgi:peptide/nickel transport system ATP-binding protein